MPIKTPGSGPNEGGNNPLDHIFKGKSEQRKRKILDLLGIDESKMAEVSDPEKMESLKNAVKNSELVEKLKTAVKIELSAGTTFDKAVERLLKSKEEGINCFIDFNGTRIYSADTDTIDDAYLQYIGMTKAEDEERSRKAQEEYRISEEQRKKREEGYNKKIEDSRKGVESVTITKDAIIKGLKFIAEHSDMEQNQLIDELIALGCNFTFKDIKEQFPDAGKLFPGMERGELAAGASVIANYMSSEFGRSYVDDRFLSLDDSTSIYACIRKLTGDATYTKEYVKSLKEKGK